MNDDVMQGVSAVNNHSLILRSEEFHFGDSLM